MIVNKLSIIKGVIIDVLNFIVKYTVIITKIILEFHCYFNLDPKLTKKLFAIIGCCVRIKIYIYYFL